MGQDAAFQKPDALLDGQHGSHLFTLPQHHREGQRRHSFHVIHCLVKPSPVKVIPVLAEQTGDLINRPVRLNFLAPGSDPPANGARRYKLRVLLGGLGLQSMSCF